MERAKNRQLQRGSTWADSAARWQQHRGEARSLRSAPRTPEPLKPRAASPPAPSHVERGQTHPRAPCGRDTRPDPALQNRSWLIPKHACPPAAAALVGSKGHGCLVLAQTHFLAAPKPDQDRWWGCERHSVAPVLGAPRMCCQGLEPIPWWQISHGTSNGGQWEEAPGHISPLARPIPEPGTAGTLLCRHRRSCFPHDTSKS